jgi:hypothetical protein
MTLPEMLDLLEAEGFELSVNDDAKGIHPAKTADQPRLRGDGLRVDFLARLCTA